MWKMLSFCKNLRQLDAVIQKDAFVSEGTSTAGSSTSKEGDTRQAQHYTRLILPSSNDTTTTTTAANNNNNNRYDSSFGAQLMTACWLGKEQIDAFLQQQQQQQHDYNDHEQLEAHMRQHFPKACQVLPLSQIRFLRLRMGPWLLHNEAYSSSDATPMHYACARFDVTILQYMIHRGASLTVPASGGSTPLHWLGRNFRPQLVVCDQSYYYYNDDDDDDELALLRAVEWVLDHVDAGALLQGDGQGVTALQNIVHCASFRVAQVLLVRLICGQKAGRGDS